MWKSTAAAVSLLTLTLAAPAPGKRQSTSTNSSTIPDFSAAPPDSLTTLGNGTLFSHWRPKAHYLPPSETNGDPMGFYVNPKTGERTISVLYSFIRSANTASFSSARTSNLVTYNDSVGWENPVVMGPGNENDALAVFDGTIIPEGYKGLPTLIYTSVSYLPISWTLPYLNGSESQSLAYSEDDGLSWIKLDAPPVIPSPPEGFNVTGWRDPFVFQSPQLDNILAPNGNLTTDSPWYITISGGIREVGPRIFLYRQAADDFTAWDFLGPVAAEGYNTTWSEDGWSGRDGVNYEVNNFLHLGDDGDDPSRGKTFLIAGTEGGRTSHNLHWNVWKAGELELSAENNSAVFRQTSGGVLDWGTAYACASFADTPTNRRIAYCWATEDFTNQTQNVVQRGYTGAHTLPRELFLHEIEDVRNDSLVYEQGSWEVKPGSWDEEDNTVTLLTLGVKPADELDDAFHSRNNTNWEENDRTLSGSSGEYTAFRQSPSTPHFELQAKIRFPESAFASESNTAAGITLFRTPDGAENITIYYQPSNESVIIERNVALGANDVVKDPEVGKLRLWNVQDDDQFERQELDITVFVDGSIVELYINDHFVITTRVYYWSPEALGLGYYIRNGSDGVYFHDVEVWEGLVNAWPERPTDPAQLLRNGTGIAQPANNPNNATLVSADVIADRCVGCVSG